MFKVSYTNIFQLQKCPKYLLFIVTKDYKWIPVGIDFLNLKKICARKHPTKFGDKSDDKSSARFHQFLQCLNSSECLSIHSAPCPAPTTLEIAFWPLNFEIFVEFPSNSLTSSLYSLRQKYNTKWAVFY